MTVREGVAVADVIRAKLGPSLEQVLDSLWIVDCQTCNQPLPGRRPALSVDELEDFAAATLHHEDCRASTWNADRHIPIGAGTMVTHHTWGAIVPVVVGDGGEEEIRPYVLINPTLELAYITRTPFGQWVVVPNPAFAGSGFAPPPFTSTPSAGAIATLSGNELTVHFTKTPLGPFVVILSDRMRDLVDVDGGVMVVMTQALDPHEVTDPVQLAPMMRGDRTVMAYVQLDLTAG